MMSTRKIVLDASTVLAVIRGERGADALTKHILARAVISAVNVTEVQSKLVKDGNDPENAWNDAVAVVSTVEPYTAEQAKIAGTLISQTGSRGLSLGDRSCLALAIIMNASVYTYDEVWRDLKIGVEIHLMR
jgi:PIN domain nuclease of toxin-antitoxin system